MKRFLSFVIMAIVTVIPFTVNAASEIIFSCGDTDAEGNRTCVVGYNIDDSTPQSSVNVNLTEHGGAEVLSIEGIASSNFTLNSQNESNGVHSVILSSPDSVSGEQELFTFTYKNSGTEDCKVTISIGTDNKEVVTETVDTPIAEGEEPQTGATLPFIALGTIALIAGATYFTTKNKTKMYKI